MTTPTNKDDFWPCACVKRDDKGNLTHIKLNDPRARRCDKCKAKRPAKGWNKKPENAQ